MIGMGVLIPLGKGYSRWSRPWDWLRVGPHDWDVPGPEGWRRFFGDRQCAWCGMPIVDGSGYYCNNCFHFMARYGIPLGAVPRRGGGWVVFSEFTNRDPGSEGDA